MTDTCLLWFWKIGYYQIHAASEALGIILYLSQSLLTAGIPLELFGLKQCCFNLYFPFPMAFSVFPNPGNTSC